MRMIDADALSRIVKLAWETSDSEDFEKSVFIAIATAPTIEERKTGKWIMGKCDQCGAHAPFWPMASTYYESDYCPNCGSEMRGDDHETD